MKIIGHRGARGLAPENTLEALQKGKAAGAYMLEVDIRVTEDKVPILSHDPALADDSGHEYSIDRYTYRSLHKHQPGLLTLAEALDAFGPETRFYLEVKPHVGTKPVAAILERKLAAGWAPENLRLASKSQEVLRELHEQLPQLPCIVIESWSSIRARHRAKQVGTKTISMNQRFLWSGFIRAVAHGGWELYAYTLNNPRKARRWAKAGLAGIVTDYPDRF